MVTELSGTENNELVFYIGIVSSHDMIYVTVSGAICSSTHYSCFEDVELIRDLSINLQNKVCSNSK